MLEMLPSGTALFNEMPALYGNLKALLQICTYVVCLSLLYYKILHV